MNDTVPLLAASRGDYQVEFDRKHGTRYRLGVVSLVWLVLALIVGGHVGAAVSRGRADNLSLVLFFIVAVLVLKALRRWQRKEFDAQKCVITDRRIVLKTGWLNRSTKFIPLDRIQDVNVREGWFQRFCKVKSIEIQTAGLSHPHCARARLLAPVNATEVRDAIMQRRDILVLGADGQGAKIGAGSASEETRALTATVGDLKNAVTRIEGLLHTGLQRLGEKDHHVAVSVNDVAK